MTKLEEAWESGKSEFIVVYGRRRVGKSYLLKHFFKDKKGIYYQALKRNNLEAISSTVAEALHGNTDILYPSFYSILKDIASASKDDRMFFIIDEIQFLSEEFEVISLLQQFVDNVSGSTQLVLVLCGSSRSFMEQEILSDPSPLYGRRTLQLKLMPFLPEESAELLPTAWSLREKPPLTSYASRTMRNS